MLLGISSKVLSSRTNMRAALLEQFPNIRDSSIIGAGDPEMTRDKHSVFPGSVGGYADWYVGTTLQLSATEYVTDQITAMFHSPTDPSLTGYAVYVTNDQIPCLYSVLSIQDEETLDYIPIKQQGKFVQNQLAVSADGAREDNNTPVIYDAVEGVFSPYHYTAIQFETTLPVKKIRITATYAPQIAEIQNWVLASGQAPLGLDILVKAAIPTSIKFSAVLNTPAGESVNYVSLQNLTADHINHLPFNGLLAVSGLLALLHRNLPAGSFVTIPALFAQTLLPTGETVFSQTQDRLVIDFPPYVSNRTTLFYCDPADISFEHRFI
jgi:hypothetical protein